MPGSIITTPHLPQPHGVDAESPVIRVFAISCALLAITGCGHIQMQQCVREMVSSNEPYPTQVDRDDSEALARQLCLRKLGGKGT